MTRDQPRLSFWASIGPTRRRAAKVAASRVDELDQLPDKDLLREFEEPSKELLADDRGRRYEAEISVSRKDRDVELTVSVADLPRRRTLVGEGFRRRHGETCGRTVLLYFSG